MVDLNELRRLLGEAATEAERLRLSRAAQDRITGAIPIIDVLEAARERQS